MGATEYCSGGVGKESSFARFLASFDFRLLQQYRHKCEAPTASRDVRVREKSGRHLLGLSISHFVKGFDDGPSRRIRLAPGPSSESLQ
jgi:hypothetical protein